MKSPCFYMMHCPCFPFPSMQTRVRFSDLFLNMIYLSAPIPGGCCLTCTMQMDPNLVITSKQYYKSSLSFPLANVYDYNTSDCSGQRGSNPHHYRLHYAIYQYFLEEGNLKNDELFDGISKMLTPAKVKENGKKVYSYLSPRQRFPCMHLKFSVF